MRQEYTLAWTPSNYRQVLLLLLLLQLLLLLLLLEEALIFDTQIYTQ